MKKEFDTLQVVAAVTRAYEINGEIHRVNYTVNGTTVRANREIAIELLATPMDVTQAQADVDYFKQCLMIKTLQGKSSGNFTTMVASLLEHDKCSDISIMVWFPKMLKQLQAFEQRRETWTINAPHSNYIKGEIGAKVTVSFELLEKRYIRGHNFWSVVGITPNGDLVAYIANNENKIINKGQITGKIKNRHIDSYRCDAKITTLNYVKVTDDNPA
jgi:adenylate kinase family enzyme